MPPEGLRPGFRRAARLRAARERRPRESLDWLKTSAPAHRSGRSGPVRSECRQAPRAAEFAGSRRPRRPAAGGAESRSDPARRPQRRIRAGRCRPSVPGPARGGGRSPGESPPGVPWDSDNAQNIQFHSARPPGTQTQAGGGNCDGLALIPGPGAGPGGPMKQ